MIKTVYRKNPIIAGLLALLLGPFGYLYLGYNFVIAGIVIAIIISVVIMVLHMPYPIIFTYFQLIVYAYYGYKFAHVENILLNEENISEEDVKNYKSISWAFYLMIFVMMSVVRLYAFVICIFFLIIAISQKKILLAFLILFFGFVLVRYLIDLIFSNISIGIIKIFKIDRRYM